MAINWNRGMFRLWIVGSILWMLLCLLYAVQDSIDHLDLLRSSCDPSTTEFRECYRQASEKQITYFWSVLSGYGMWLLVALPPLIAFGVGKITIKIAAWIARGFASS
jgi:hypothetical protein